MKSFRLIYLLCAAFAFGFGPVYLLSFEQDLGVRIERARLSGNMQELKAVKRYLKDYRQATGRYPTNDEGLLVLKRLRRDKDAARRSGNWNNPVAMMRMDATGVLSPWAEPFIYENRRHAPPKAFVDSGVDTGADRYYSIIVDDDIYVWSFAARLAYREYRHDVILMWTLWCLTLALGVSFMALYVRDKRRSVSPERKTGRTVLALIIVTALSLVLGMVALPFLASCYRWSVISSSRSPKRTAEYLALMSKYHERGVISDTAYAKIVKAMENADPFVR